MCRHSNMPALSFYNHLNDERLKCQYFKNFPIFQFYFT
jgi:hypothetical protein